MTKSIGKINSNLCPECGGFILYSQFQGEETCSQCGLIINERLFNRSDNGKKKSEIIIPTKATRHYYNYNQKRIYKRNNWPNNNYNRNLKFAFIQLKLSISLDLSNSKYLIMVTFFCLMYKLLNLTNIREI